MKLAEAIKGVTTDFGLLIMKDENILNLLNDYSAFDDWKAAKHVISILLQNATINKLLLFINNNQSPVSLLKQMQSDLCTSYGIKDELIKYVHNEIIDGFGLSVEKLVLSSAPKSQPNDAAEDINSSQSVSSQKDDGKHLQFKNISIHGDPQIIVKQLEAQGFSVAERGPEGIVLHGTYAGVTNCTLFVAVSPFIDEACSIFVQFPEQYSWWALKSEYLKFKEKLIQKYGNPESYEYFTYPYEEGDGYELTALDNNNCTYISKFKAENGEIGLFLSSSHCVGINYADGDCARRIEEKQNHLSDTDL